MKDQIVNRGSLFSFLTVSLMLFALHGTTYGQTVLSIDPASIESPMVGEQFDINIDITGGANVGAYSFDLIYDSSALLLVEVKDGGYLKTGLLPPFVAGPVPAAAEADGQVTMAATAIQADGSDGDGTLATARFEVIEVKDSSISLESVSIAEPDGTTGEITIAGSAVTGAAAPLVDETPVDETPVDETPVDETPVDETPVDESPVDETPVDETLVDEMPTEESAAAPPIEADQTFTVTLENLTVGTPTESGQIFSPALFITHTSSVSFVEAGTAASEELRDIAEMGDNAPLSALAMGTEGVKDVQSAEGVLFPGASTSVMIDGGMDGWLLSFASMLVQTNDALVAGNSLSLFDEAGAPRTFTMNIMTYDAGTEENNELATHVPGPPFDGSEQAVEGGVIMAHPGITGNADVGMEFGWMEPVARLSVAPYVAPPEEEMASFSMMLDKGLNMISLPLMPEEAFTAQTFAEAADATVVIKLDAASQKFVGFTAGEGGDGFAIEGGKGYIVNTPDGGSVTFTGMAWDNQQVAAAPGINPFRDAWAFVVSGSLQNADPQTNYTLVAKNLRTGAVATEPISTSKTRSAAVWADLNRNSVIEAGDQLEITVLDGSGNIVSGPFTHTVDIADIRQAYLRLSLVVGDVHPEQTRLAQNFPNPFNPETWMPFQLSESSFAAIQIYSASGQLVRTLDLGMKPAGFYMTRSNAAYWDGRNGAGEHVASGVYYYTLKTNDFAATRKMLISK